MDRDLPIGVFDSGIGGLSVLKQFIRFLPNEKYIYLGDTARVPYGNKSEKTVKRYARECSEFLLKHHVKLIVVACNTASSVALDAVREISDVPVIGMIAPAANAALRATNKDLIGVIGTRATINSNAYSRSIQSMSKSDKLQVFSKACPLFVPIVEEGWMMHEVARLTAGEYLMDLKNKGIDTLVLGCTHYPLLVPLITEFMPGVTLIDSGEHAAVNAIKLLAEEKMLAEEKNEYIAKPYIEFFVTDVPDTFYEIAQRFLGFKVDIPKRVNLEATV